MSTNLEELTWTKVKDYQCIMGNAEIFARIDNETAEIQLKWPSNKRTYSSNLEVSEEREQFNSVLADYGIDRQVIWKPNVRRVEFRKRPVFHAKTPDTLPQVGLKVTPVGRNGASHQVISVTEGMVSMRRLSGAGKVWEAWERQERRGGTHNTYDTPLTLFWSLWRPAQPTKKAS